MAAAQGRKPASGASSGSREEADIRAGGGSTGSGEERRRRGRTDLLDWRRADKRAGGDSSGEVEEQRGQALGGAQIWSTVR